MTFGKRIYDLRTANGFSQEELAEKLQVSRQTISKWENDIAIPEVEKLIMLKELFFVTTDFLLMGEETETKQENCGIYRTSNAELAETEKFALLFEKDGNVLSVKLYRGEGLQRKLIAVCEEEQQAKQVSFAYFSENGECVFYGKNDLHEMLGEAYDPTVKEKMEQMERFAVCPSREPFPSLEEIGVRGALALWRRKSKLWFREGFHFTLCTDKTEYVISLMKGNVYCGASNNLAFDLGLFSGGQRFRIRNCGDNTQSFICSLANFEMREFQGLLPLEYARYGEAVSMPCGMFWCVKRYDSARIVLQGCGDDEYAYYRDEPYEERYEQCLSVDRN